MDDFTKTHFNNWVVRTFRTHEWDLVEAVLLPIYEEDPEYYDNEGWPRLLAEAERREGPAFYLDR